MTTVTNVTNWVDMFEKALVEKNIMKTVATVTNWEDLLMKAITDDGMMLEYALRFIREGIVSKELTTVFCICAVEQCAEALSFVPDEMKTESIRKRAFCRDFTKNYNFKQIYVISDVLFEFKKIRGNGYDADISPSKVKRYYLELDEFEKRCEQRRRRQQDRSERLEEFLAVETC